VGIGFSALDTILKKLGFRKLCDRWVPRMLTGNHKEQNLQACADLLEWYEFLGDDFLDSIVTGDETWVHHYKPESKQQSMEWRHKNSPTKKSSQDRTSTGKVMCLVFWDRKGVILVGFLEQDLTINAARYVETLKKLKSRIARVQPEKKEHVLLQHDNARPHTALLTRECTAKLGWMVLPHPSLQP
jgi:hypothetical protein